MFLGTVFHNLDEKSRILLPTRFRLSLGERFVITYGLRHTLSIYTLDSWYEIGKKLQEPGNFNSAANLLRSVFAGGAEEMSTDAQGRLTIPQPLKEYAELKSEAVFVGAVNKVEIWDRENWRRFYAALDDEKIDQAIRELNLE